MQGSLRALKNSRFCHDIRCALGSEKRVRDQQMEIVTFNESAQ